MNKTGVWKLSIIEILAVLSVLLPIIVYFIIQNTLWFPYQSGDNLINWLGQMLNSLFEFVVFSIVTPVIGFILSILSIIFCLKNMAKIENRLEKGEERKLLRRPIIFFVISVVGFVLNVLFTLKLTYWIFL